MTFFEWLRRLGGTQPDAAKPIREATIKRASNEHTRGAGDLVREARRTGSLSIQIERDLTGRDRPGHAD